MNVVILLRIQEISCTARLFFFLFTLHSRYLHLSGGETSEALHALTGWPTETVELQTSGASSNSGDSGTDEACRNNRLAFVTCHPSSA